MKNQINELIKQAMLAKDTVRLNVLRAVKTEFMKVETAKNAKKLDEITVLRKMKKDRVDASQAYSLAGREDLSLQETEEANILNEFLPTEPTEDDVRRALKEISVGTELTQKNTGLVMKLVKELLPNVDMKLVSTIFKSML